MRKLPRRSLETYIARWFSLFALSFLALLVLYLQLLDWSLNTKVFLVCLTALIILLILGNIRAHILSAFERASLHVEAIKMEDYNQYAKPVFTSGHVGNLHRELKTLSENLLDQKSRYDQHAFLLYQLIAQLDTPILVFNQKDQLSYANDAFTLLYDQPWQMYRHGSSTLLGLSKKDGHWQLDQKNHLWQISQSKFIDDGQTHQLLVFTNIESILRASQRNAWQQIIRVMGHEIRNSLTPVSSLAESLANRCVSPRDQKALALISDRCHHLQDFISRYSSLSQQLNLHLQKIELTGLVERIKGLFSHVDLDVELAGESIWADPAFIEQVLINLIKNADEAGASHILLSFVHSNSHTRILVIDNGHGFANLENLFVPLFTTKQQGQGIGLSFCRNIIEQHNGNITLTNNASQGVTVSLTLPHK
jgi:two-component system nitrogen regulation sensor histidine kinase NtrY